jgi:hypothetical protein
VLLDTNDSLTVARRGPPAGGALCGSSNFEFEEGVPFARDEENVEAGSAEVCASL